MRVNGALLRPSAARRGKVLMLFVLLLPILVGWVGLVIDTGLLLAAHRQAQNAADAAVLAAALDKFRGASDATATATANKFLQDYNGHIDSPTLVLNNGAANAVNIPPSQGPHAGNSQYVEVILTVPVQTLFIQVLGINQNQTAVARAVAGYEPVGSGEGAIVLDSTASPGISINNSNARLIVNGTLVVNSQGQGKDQYGNTVGSLNHPAITTNGQTITPAPIVAQDVQVVGGVDNMDNFRVYDPAFSANGYFYDPNNPDRSLFASAPIAPDPLASLATPTTSSPGTAVNATSGQYVKNGQTFVATFASPGNASIGNGDTATFGPGIYTNIKITGGTVTFNPGIFVLLGANNGGLTINGGTVTGNGVLFYNTGSDYNPTSGSPDSGDGNLTPNPPGSTRFGAISVNGGSVNLAPLNDTNSPFNGLLFYQRRWNTQTLGVGGNSNDVNINGTSYAKWALFQLGGQGKYNAQFLVGSMAISGNATVTINATGKNRGKANLVFLVE